ncbi:MurR/RpiR family transcriptional regulator, partial [Lapillicoccus sp.]|uniref:MurR/RpiR family transcriptional regulator n=1 Tax=Lapillicoccus sp. TaxID=1909287 RepID=UPI0032660E41
MTRLAMLLMDDPRAPLKLSITDLAARAGTSAATVTRFCRLIGYAGYTPFRLAVAIDSGWIESEETWRVDNGCALNPYDTPDEVLGTLAVSHMRALEATAGSVVLPDIVRIAHAIASSKRVDIYGIGGSALMAVEMQMRLCRIGINAHAWEDVHDGLTSAALQDESSVAIGISNTGRTAETIEMLAQAKSSGSLTLALTGNPDSPLAGLAEIHLATYAPDECLRPGDLSARHAQLFAIDLLYLIVVQQNLLRITSATQARRLIEPTRP